MKRFHELTKQQQVVAVNYAESELKSLISLGIIELSKPGDAKQIKEFATIAAEEAWYPQPQDKVLDDIATQE